MRSKSEGAVAFFVLDLVGVAIGHIVRTLMAWHDRARERRQLLSLSDHQPGGLPTEKPRSRRLLDATSGLDHGRRRSALLESLARRVLDHTAEIGKPVSAAEHYLRANPAGVSRLEVRGRLARFGFSDAV